MDYAYTAFWRLSGSNYFIHSRHHTIAILPSCTEYNCSKAYADECSQAEKYLHQRSGFRSMAVSDESISISLHWNAPTLATRAIEKTAPNMIVVNASANKISSVCRMLPMYAPP